MIDGLILAGVILLVIAHVVLWAHVVQLIRTLEKSIKSTAAHAKALQKLHMELHEARDPLTKATGGMLHG